MPLALPILPMSIDEFHVMDHRLGWKHEYWDGAARLSCQPTAIVSLELRITPELTAPRRIGDGYKVGNVSVGDRPDLVELFLATFDCGIEYAGWSDADYQRDAEVAIDSFFGCLSKSPQTRRAGHLKHSFAVWHEKSLVAAILVRTREHGPIIEPIMVAHAHQRRGLGSALLAASARSLVDAGVGVLRSRCHLGNAPSLNWHQRSGFRELPDYFAASHRALHFRWQAEHYASRNQQERAAEMFLQAEHWERTAEVKQMSLLQRPPNPCPSASPELAEGRSLPAAKS